MGVLAKVFTTVPLTVASILGVVQVAIKLIKEIITAIINILFPVFPDTSKFKRVVMKIRDVINNIDWWVEKIKVTLLP